MKSEICDFCGTTEPVWEFPARDFYNAETNAESTGGWLACDTCAALVCTEDYEALAQRTPLNPTVAVIMMDLGEEGRRVVIDWARRFHQQFKEHRTGEPVRISEEERREVKSE